MIMTPLLNKAVKLASYHHAGQWWGRYPYTVHLDRVERELAFWGFAAEWWRAAAWLHDIIEDTSYTQNQLNDDFPSDLAIIICAVTDPPGYPREQAKELVYRWLGQSWKAAVVKLADRIVNTEFSAEERGRHWDMYQKENPALLRAIAPHRRITDVARMADKLVGLV